MYCVLRLTPFVVCLVQFSMREMSYVLRNMPDNLRLTSCVLCIMPHVVLGYVLHVSRSILKHVSDTVCTKHNIVFIMYI